MLFIIIIRISLIYSDYIIFKKKKFQDNIKQIKTIKDYFNQHYLLFDTANFGPKYNEYFDSLSYEDQNIILGKPNNFFSYKNKKYRNIAIKEMKLYQNIKKNKKTILFCYEFTLNIHIELIQKINVNLEKFNNYYDFPVIYVTEQVNTDNKSNQPIDYNNFELFKLLILITAQKFKIYFKFNLINVFYNEYTSFISPKMIVLEFFLCIKKNKYAAFSAHLFELIKESDLQLNFEIKKLINNVDYFTRKDFYNCFSYEINILNYQIMAQNQTFDIFNGSLYLDIYYELGFYLNLVELHNSNYLSIENYISLLKEEYNYTNYLYERDEYYKYLKIKKYTRLYIMDNSNFLYAPNIFRLFYIKYCGGFVVNVDNLKRTLVSKVNYYAEKGNNYKPNMKNFYIKLFFFLITYCIVTYLYY